MKVLSLINEARKKQSLPSSSIIKQIQAGWKGRIDILKSLKEKCTLLEDIKSAMFFKVSNPIVELGVPPLIWDSKLISPDNLEVVLSKLKDKCYGKFDNI